MHLIWKRPDGFHGASPDDYSVVELDGHSRLWLHKTDKDQYPFRVSGGWEEREATVRINNLVNLLPHSRQAWIDYLNDAFSHSMKENAKDFVEETKEWLRDLSLNTKGDTWEVEILEQALAMTVVKLTEVEAAFLTQNQSPS